MIPLEKLVTRDVFGTWLQANGVTGTGVEIGTYYGDFALTLSRQWSAGMLLTIDPYCWNTDPTYVDGCRTDWADQNRAELDPEKVFLAAARKLAEQKNCRMIRVRSVDAALGIEDESLAFVFIDGNHAEEAVEADIAAWFPKVRPGGIFAGHDFYNRDDELMKCGVFNAVWRFAHEKGWKPHVTQCTSWWFIKP